MNILKRLFTIKKVNGIWYWGCSDKEIRLGEQLSEEIKLKEEQLLKKERRQK